MRLLLDSHVALWFLQGSGRLARSSVRRITNPRNQSWVSIASVWEISIKLGLGKLRLPSPLLEGLAGTGLELLPIDAEHAVAAGSLPRHHADPFDRLLVAQALIEEMTLVTHDQRMAAYGVKILPA